MKLVALTGLHGAGKDTVADALPARKLAFADALYREVSEAFGVTVAELKCREGKEAEQEWYALERCRDYDFRVWFFHQPVASATREPWDTTPRSPRQILQWWGDYRRSHDPEYFTSRTREAARINRAFNRHVVITDCRYPNEAAMVRQLGGQIWQIVRPGHEPPRTGHASETDGLEFAPDVVIVNDGTVEQLRATALKEWNK